MLISVFVLSSFLWWLSKTDDNWHVECLFLIRTTYKFLTKGQNTEKTFPRGMPLVGTDPIP